LKRTQPGSHARNGKKHKKIGSSKKKNQQQEKIIQPAEPETMTTRPGKIMQQTNNTSQKEREQPDEALRGHASLAALQELAPAKNPASSGSEGTGQVGL
jgi:hypothetical protein